jgi:hypothetical protein
VPSLRPLLALCAVCFCAACGSGSRTAPFVRGVDNPWFPLPTGTAWIYTGVKDGERGRDVVHVTGETKMIRGVDCTAVDDRLYLDGRLAERTTDWYAQDHNGTVWYFGEATAELDASGRVTSHEGSWLAGVGGAREGIFMPAHPRVGASFRQEYLKGHAEDHFAVLRVSRGRLLTREWTPLEPDALDHKVYERGVGLVREETIKGGDERFALVRMRQK